MTTKTTKKRKCAHGKLLSRECSDCGAMTGEKATSAFPIRRLWLWKNGSTEYWAFDNPYPCYPNGDHMTLGEPCGIAILKDSNNGRPDRTEEYATQQMEAAHARAN